MATTAGLTASPARRIWWPWKNMIDWQIKKRLSPSLSQTGGFNKRFHNVSPVLMRNWADQTDSLHDGAGVRLSNLHAASEIPSVVDDFVDHPVSEHGGEFSN